jgi:hypothetical protein
MVCDMIKSNSILGFKKTRMYNDVSQIGDLLQLTEK